MIGKKFGRLTIINSDVIRDSKGRLRYKCVCECGEFIEVDAYNMKSGKIKSCGCYRIEVGQINAAEKFKTVEGTHLSKIKSDALQRNNTSGVKGVSYEKSSNKWRAFISFKGKRHYLGRFVCKKDAIKARNEAEKKYFNPILDKYKVGDTTGE